MLFIAFIALSALPPKRFKAPPKAFMLFTLAPVIADALLNCVVYSEKLLIAFLKNS